MKALALLALAASLAHGEGPAYLYQARVVLRSGKTVEAATYGLTGHFPGAPAYKPVRSVQLSQKEDQLAGDFTFSRGEKASYRLPLEQAASMKLVMFPSYQAFKNPPSELDYFLIPEDRLIPLKDIARVETLKVVGKGFTIVEDPGAYAGVQEPFLEVADCETRCKAKLYSEDGSVGKEKLSQLWEKHLSCQARFSESGGEMDAVMARYKLQIKADPFCAR